MCCFRSLQHSPSAESRPPMFASPDIGSQHHDPADGGQLPGSVLREGELQYIAESAGAGSPQLGPAGIPDKAHASPAVHDESPSAHPALQRTACTPDVDFADSPDMLMQHGECSSSVLIPTDPAQEQPGPSKFL